MGKRKKYKGSRRVTHCIICAKECSIDRSTCSNICADTLAVMRQAKKEYAQKCIQAASKPLNMTVINARKPISTT